jgi:hypothetical protein
MTRRGFREEFIDHGRYTGISFFEISILTRTGDAPFTAQVASLFLSAEVLFPQRPLSGSSRFGNSQSRGSSDRVLRHLSIPLPAAGHYEDPAFPILQHL